jgi:hypothetical protein
LPKPTSPQTRRSIGLPEAMSVSTSSMARPDPRSRAREAVDERA